jgi:integrase
MRHRLTPGFIKKAALPEKGDRVLYWDTELRGFGLQVTKSGHRSFIIQYRFHGFSQRMATDSVLTLDEARRWAKKMLGQVANGINPLDKRREERRKARAAASNSLKAICEEYLHREGRKQDKLRSLERRRATLERLVFPRPIAAKPIGEVRRSDITRLLDQIADGSGEATADIVLALLRRIMSWHAARSDDYSSPIVRGMARTKPAERARERTLTDDELRAIWKAADGLGTPFARMVQFILLTAVRRNEAARMDRSEVAGDEWTIPAARMKGKKDFLVPLTAAAKAIFAQLPVIGDAESGPVFTTDGRRPIAGFAVFKAAFDKACGVTGWTIHDLRRTARTLLSRAGVSVDIAERVLAHVIGGIRGVYDRHEFKDEKRGALESLASQIERILNPPAGNVVPLKAPAQVV